jgi:hypothetical protein
MGEKSVLLIFYPPCRANVLKIKFHGVGGYISGFLMKNLINWAYHLIPQSKSFFHLKKRQIPKSDNFQKAVKSQINFLL